MWVRRSRRMFLLMALMVAVGATTVSATTISKTISFSIPDVYNPTCVTRNGETTCTPDQTASTFTINVSITEAENITVKDGAPLSQANGQSCSMLAKTIIVELKAGGSVSVNRDDTVIAQPVTATVPGQSEHLEICQN